MQPGYLRSDFVFLRFSIKKPLIFCRGLDRIIRRDERESEKTEKPNRFHAPRLSESLEEPEAVFEEQRVLSADHKRDDDLARLESVLFLAREPLSSRKLAQFADIFDGSQARKLVLELNRRYSSQPCAFQVVEVAGGFQLRARPQFAPWLLRLQEVPIEVRLSTTAMETLAVVALKQPVLRAEIESIRGVQCGEMLRQLMERNLVKIVGRSEELGRPFLYGTTRFFLQVFGLKTLEEFSRRFKEKEGN